MKTPSQNRLILQGEGAAIAAVAISAYALLGGGWIFFALLILVPDVFMLGYLANARFGALCYNIGHSLLAPLALGAAALAGGNQTALEVALIWAAHVGLDRAIGYGLKYPSGFKDTHLGRV